MATAVATLDGGLWKVREIQAFCFFWDQDLTFDLLFKARVDSQQVEGDLQELSCLQLCDWTAGSADFLQIGYLHQHYLASSFYCHLLVEAMASPTSWLSAPCAHGGLYGHGCLGDLG
eukprot:CAMPEP_0170510364 /NCGR_PEP_ID=MMETSP0208-20121228/65725_1 /TAXON_ID=197538 /ORGANISM="Strombidium inclinatum, Strain S3" /LENGTH=116 /DNA_ID=CAMNT_0010793819 /DNA_START=1880 /DNA_END=2225 /DNA_ORIENTATION=-